MAKYNQPIPDPIYPKEKIEDYRLLEGINTKVSLYLNGPTEFRDISNMNFVNSGALTKRPGTTLFGGTTLQVMNGFMAPLNITSGYEFSRLNGISFVITSGGGALVAQYASFIQGCLAFQINGLGGNIAPVQPGALFSFVTFVDRLFGCNGTQFYRITNNQFTNSPEAYLASLPSPTDVGLDALGLTGLPGNTAGGPCPNQLGLSGTFVFGFSFVNDRGYIGPASRGHTFQLAGTQCVMFGVGYGFTTLNGLANFYGITALQLYRSEIDGVVLTQTTSPQSAINFAGITTIAYDILGTTASVLSDTAAVANQDFYLGGTLYFGQNGQFPFGKTAAPMFIPRFLEIYNNQMFMAGFSLSPSTFWWSDIGEPEGVQPESSVEVRSNDGDVLSGMKACLGSLLITKRKSVHLLSGTDPTSFLLQEISNQYGCVSHQAIVPWNNVVWFLDSKGIMEYNGANLSCVSTAIEPIFNNMNLQAAYDNACGIHVKKFNELWWSIPANGSTINNQIIVHDYVTHAWTHYDGVQAQCLFNAFAGFPTQVPFAGNYTGGLVYFDPTLTSDNDQGITCSFNSVFFAARGQTTENMYRRFYLDVAPVLGFTQPINFTFQTNYGSTIQLSRTMYQAPYQSRIDFGLSARTIQASMYHYSASLPLQVNGFTFESRFMRSV